MSWNRGYNTDIVEIFNTNLPLIATMLDFSQICWASTVSDRPIEKTCTHTHTSQLYIWVRLLVHFLFPSVTQSVSEWGSYLLLSYLYSRLMEKFKFGITSDCWPEPISDNWLAPRFHYPHASKHHTTKSHTLLSRHTFLAYLKPLCPNVLSLFHMHEDRN